MTSNYDAIVIGTGQSGPALAARLHKEGQKTAIIERKLVGGTCVNVGCTPTKTLVGSARIAYLARQAGVFGISIDGDIGVDMGRVKARKDAIAGASNQGVTDWLDGMDNVDLIRGHARFVAAHSVEVNGTVIEADRIFINVGGRAAVPPMPGLDTVEYLTNSTVMDIDVLPEHLIIIGGSYVGLEFAQMYRRFGSEVTVVEMGPRLIEREDHDVSEEVKTILGSEGVNIRLDAECITAERSADGFTVGLDCDTGDKSATGTHLLLAVGRRPNTDDLGLDAAGVEVDGRGYIVVDDQLRTNVTGIWALGDCNAQGAFTHTAYNDYEIVAANLLDDDPRRVTDRFTCYGLFIDPPLGRVGMTETEIRAIGRNGP